MINSHYVPRLILRKFSDKLSLYNVKTGELKENIPIEHAYAIEDYYDSETEKKLNRRIESQFGDLLSNYLLKCDKEISLSRKQLYLIKKFLLIAVLRSIHGEAFMQKEKRFYENLQNKAKREAARQGLPYDEKAFAPPFEERQIEGETTFQYWMRTLNVILDTDGTPQGIMDHPDKTYPAYRWSKIINDAYLGFWDAPNDRDEFVITDIGMTSENEKGWNGITTHNHKKLDYFMSLLDEASDEKEKLELARLMYVTTSFHENFQMFPISSKRMIVLIAPFFKFRYMNRLAGNSVPPLEYITEIPNEILYEPNRNYYTLFHGYIIPMIEGEVLHISSIPGEFKEQYVKYDDNEHDTTLMIFRSDYFVQIRDFVRMSEDIIMGLYYNPDERTYLEQGLYERLLEKCETEKAKKAIETVYKFLIEKKEE